MKHLLHLRVGIGSHLWMEVKAEAVTKAETVVKAEAVAKEEAVVEKAPLRGEARV